MSILLNALINDEIMFCLNDDDRIILQFKNHRFIILKKSKIYKNLLEISALLIAHDLIS